MAVDSRQLPDLIVRMLAYWSLVWLAALPAVQIDLSSHINYFVRFAEVVDASMTAAFGQRTHCDTVAAAHTTPCTMMRMNSERFRLLLSIVELVDCPMRCYCWSTVSVVIRRKQQQQLEQ